MKQVEHLNKFYCPIFCERCGEEYEFCGCKIRRKLRTLRIKQKYRDEEELIIKDSFEEDEDNNCECYYECNCEDSE